MRARNQELLHQNVKLIEQEKVFRCQYDRLHEGLNREKAVCPRPQADALWKILIEMSGNVRYLVFFLRSLAVL